MSETQTTEIQAVQVRATQVTTTPEQAAQTLTTQTAAMAMQNIPALIGLVAGNRLVTVNATIQAALTRAETDATGEIERLKAAFDAFEAENPMVAAALDAARRSSVALGLDFPGEDQVVAQVKAAAVDLIGALLARPAA
ncbi:MAG: hypothetical protein ACRYGC_07565 [Janthinobacterium lividum]